MSAGCVETGPSSGMSPGFSVGLKRGRKLVAFEFSSARGFRTGRERRGVGRK